MFPTNDLVAFVAVADSGSIRRAAEVLGRTQPAVTQAIQRLEHAVGFELLDRSGYRVRLTEQGEMFAKRARASVKQARDLRAFASTLSRGVEARLRIAVHGAIDSASWLHLIDALPARFTETVLEVQDGEGDAPLRALLNETADLALLLHSIPDHHTHAFVHQEVGEVEFVNVMRATCEGEDVSHLPQILVADFEDPAARYGVVEGHRYWRVGDHRLKAALIVRGLGWGAVPLTLVQSALDQGALRMTDYGGLRPRSRRPVYLCRKRDKARGPVAEFIWRQALQEPSPTANTISAAD